EEPNQYQDHQARPQPAARGQPTRSGRHWGGDGARRSHVPGCLWWVTRGGRRSAPPAIMPCGRVRSNSCKCRNPERGPAIRGTRNRLTFARPLDKLVKALDGNGPYALDARATIRDSPNSSVSPFGCGSEPTLPRATWTRRFKRSSFPVATRSAGVGPVVLS